MNAHRSARVKRGIGLAVITVGLALIATACPWTKAVRSDRGGTLTVAAWEPDCADPLLQCSINAWYGAYPTMTLQTLPRVVDSRNGHYVPSVLLAAAPSLDPGPPQRVTYHINPKAVWSDGQPITSSDFHFTWSAIVHEKDVLDPTGYNQIQSIDDSDIAAVEAVLRSDWLTQGPAVGRFERAVADHTGAAHALAMNSATSALHVACAVLDVGPHSRVWTVPNTFVA